MIELQKFTFNPFQENTYVIWETDSKQAIIVDPGCSNNLEQKELTQFINDKNLSVKYLINTHCHIDHILGNKFVKEKYSCEFYAPELDIPLLDKLMDQAKMFGFPADKSPNPDEFITEDLTLKIGEAEMEFLFTPGHSPGEYCILFKNEDLLIAGDVLFLEGIGRTDLWGGNYETLINSIEQKLFTLNDETIVYPGHGDKTTIGYEKLNNPFLK